MLKKNIMGKIYKRPWGSYETLVLEKNYQVKKIMVKSGGCLSLQKHFKRAEYWVIVMGTPTVIIGKKKKKLAAGDHVYNPLETVHRVMNLSKNSVVFIEVQYGTYLGEDDIVRLADIYDRA